MQVQVDQFLRYLRSEKGYSENTIAAYQNDLRQFITLFSQITAGSIDSWAEVDHQLIQAYGKYLEEQSYASSTVARKVAAVRSFFSFMLDADLLTDNPALALNAPKVEKQVPRILSVEEVERLLAEPARGTTPKALRDRALLELLYATGTRVSEAITLQLDDLDLAEACLFCTGRDGKRRRLSLSPQALKALFRYLEKGRDALLQDRAETTLFVNQRGRPLTRQGLWLIIRSYAEAADLGPGVTPHTLRHTCAAHRLAQGSDLQKVRELLGHANISSTQVYVDLVSPFDGASDADLV